MGTAERPPLMRWTVERFIALVESGVIPEGRGIELLDGQVVTEMPQGKLHFLVFRALQLAFEAMEAAKHGMVAQPTILFRGDNALDPEFALLRAEYGARDLPRAEDVRLVIEVSVTSLGYDLGEKKRIYARAGISEYWVFDASRGGIWVFRDPAGGDYAETRFVPAGESIEVPQVSLPLDTATIFPAPQEDFRNS